MDIIPLIYKDAQSADELGEYIVKRCIEDRLKYKKNVIFFICGGIGEGKSYAALRIAELIEPNFNVREQVIYYPLHFLETINNAVQKNYKVLVLDEAHTTIPSRLWYSFSNLAIHFVLTTFRQVKNMALIIVAPNLMWIDKTLREMINFYGVVDRVRDRQPLLKLYHVGFNYFNLEEQSPYLRRLTFYWKKRIYKVCALKLNKPSEKIIEEYENYATVYKKELIQKQLENTMGKISKALDIGQKTNISEIANTLIENQKLLFTLMKKRKDGMELKKGEVKRLFKLSDSEIEQLNAEVIEKARALGWI
jgi:hypothetical protein